MQPATPATEIRYSRKGAIRCAPSVSATRASRKATKNALSSSAAWASDAPARISAVGPSPIRLASNPMPKAPSPRITQSGRKALALCAGGARPTSCAPSTTTSSAAPSARNTSP